MPTAGLLGAAGLLPILWRGPTPDAVDRIAFPGERQAFLSYPTTRADPLRLRDLLQGRSGRRDGEEEVWIDVHAGTGRAPVSGTSSHGGHVGGPRCPSARLALPHAREHLGGEELKRSLQPAVGLA